MCSSLYSKMMQLFNENDAKMLGDYFNGLTGNAVDTITVSKASSAMGISIERASSLLQQCNRNGIISISFAARCPECGMLICRYKSYSEIPDDSITCYSCQEEITLTTSDIEIVYSLNSDFFPRGQSEKDIISSPYQIALTDTLSALLQNRRGNKNDIFYNPTDEDYDELRRLFNNAKMKSSSTKKQGDSLEDLCRFLFNRVYAFRAVSVKTETNQIDCYIRNQLLPELPYLGERIVVECKNENEKPGNTYFHKISGIIDGINGKNNHIVQIGIIISRREPAKTIQQLAVLRYARDNLVLITITMSEIEHMIMNKENLLEIIERKREEIVLNTSMDLIRSGLFDA